MKNNQNWNLSLSSFCALFRWLVAGLVESSFRSPKRQSQKFSLGKPRQSARANGLQQMRFACHGWLREALMAVTMGCNEPPENGVKKEIVSLTNCTIPVKWFRHAQMSTFHHSSVRYIVVLRHLFQSPQNESTMRSPKKDFANWLNASRI